MYYISFTFSTWKFTLDGHLDWNKNDNNVTKDLGENFWMNNIFYCYIIYG